MSLTVDLPPELESELAVEAARLGLSVPDYVLQLLASGRSSSSRPKTGPELIAYWRNQGLIGTRPQIADSAAHARGVRAKAQQRARR